MPNFEVRVRMLDVSENDAWSARRSVEERLRAAGFKRWQIVSLRLQDAPQPGSSTGVRRPTPRRRVGAPVGPSLFVAAAVALSLWFWWTLF